MKVIVTAEGPRVESPVDPRFGRAKYFVLVDTETGEHAAHDNAQNLNAAQGAGIQAAQCVARLGAEAVVTGHVGPKAFTTLQAAGIAIYTGASGTVGEAVESLRAGQLQQAAQADVEGRRPLRRPLRRELHHRGHTMKGSVTDEHTQGAGIPSIGETTPADWRPGDDVIVPPPGSCGTAEDCVRGKEEGVDCRE